MTWRAWSARLTVSSAPGSGGRCSTIGVRDLAQGRAHGVDAGEVARPRTPGSAAAWTPEPVGALEVDDAAIDEPVERRVERRELLERETILGVVGVQEVEGVVEVDVVGVAPVGRARMSFVNMSITTLDQLTGYAQGVHVHQ